MSEIFDVKKFEELVVTLSCSPVALTAAETPSSSVQFRVCQIEG